MLRLAQRLEGEGYRLTYVGVDPLGRIDLAEFEAALTGDVERVYHAVALDPLTAAVCTLPQIREMVDEMLAAQTQWLPQFQR